MKKNISIFILLVVLLISTGCSDKSDSKNGSENNTTGGTELNIAHNAAPPTLDWHATGATSTRDITMLIYETLVTVDSDFQPVPMLAETIDESEDGRTYTFHLREGIKFHNGEEMIAEDVVASMERWMEKSDIAGQIFDHATWEEDGDYTVILTLEEPSSLTLDTIATTKQAPAIMPKEILDDAPVEGVDEYIGTGPYQFDEWKHDQYIRLTKYDEYAPLDKESDGWSGKKEALVEDIYFHFVSDTATRVAGVQTGEYDFGYDIPFDMYDQLTNDPDLNTFIASPANAVVKFNTKEGIGNDVDFRSIVNTALDYEAIMAAAFPHEDAYELTNSYMDKQIINWASDAGSEYYNINDPEKAEQMLKDYGYNGEPFRILTTRDYDYVYNISVVLNEQLNNIGINSSLEVYDWPTVVEMTGNDSELGSWDVTVSGSSMVSIPPQLISLSSSWAGGVNDSYILDMMNAIEFEPDLETAKELWEELQQYAWEEYLPTLQIGSFGKLYISRSKVSDIDTLVGPIFWNVSIGE